MCVWLTDNVTHRGCCGWCHRCHLASQHLRYVAVAFLFYDCRINIVNMQRVRLIVDSWVGWQGKESKHCHVYSKNIGLGAGGNFLNKKFKLHDDLHWLDVADWVKYKLGIIIYRCHQCRALWYFVDCCTPVTGVAGRQRLRSGMQQLMVVPWHRLSTVSRRAFDVQCPMVWNSLPDDVRAQQDYVSLKQGLKTSLFSRYYHTHRIRNIVTLYSINLHLSFNY